MTRQVAITLLLLCLSVVSHGIPGEESLRRTLEKTWEAHLQASKSGKEFELRKTMSSFRLGTMKNNLAAAKRSLTQDVIRSISEHALALSEAEFEALLEKGDTAGLVYVKDSEEKDATGKPRVTFIFIKFVKEDIDWKVDGLVYLDDPKFQEDGTQTEFDPDGLPPTYQVDGQVRTAPEPVEPPYASGLLDVFSYGYRTEVSVNGVREGKPVEASRSGLIRGGLRKGKNTVTIVVVRTEEETSFHPRVSIRRVLANRETEEVFKFEPEENIEGKHTLGFTIDE